MQKKRLNNNERRSRKEDEMMKGSREMKTMMLILPVCTNRTDFIRPVLESYFWTLNLKLNLKVTEAIFLIQPSSSFFFCFNLMIRSLIPAVILPLRGRWKNLISVSLIVDSQKRSKVPQYFEPFSPFSLRNNSSTLSCLLPLYERRTDSCFCYCTSICLSLLYYFTKTNSLLVFCPNNFFISFAIAYQLQRIRILSLATVCKRCQVWWSVVTCQELILQPSYLFLHILIGLTLFAHLISSWFFRLTFFNRLSLIWGHSSNNRNWYESISFRILFFYNASTIL